MPFSTNKSIPCRKDIFDSYDIVIAMNKHENKTVNSATPPRKNPLVLVKVKESYRVWHRHLNNIKKIDRNTIGNKIDLEFLDLLEILFKATFAYDKFEKLSLVSNAIGKNDLLKFFLQIGWEEKVCDNKKYAELILLLDEVGRMLGGWKRHLQDKTPTK